MGDDIFSCHACGKAWGLGPAGQKAHRAACPQYSNFCAKLLDTPAESAWGRDYPGPWAGPLTPGPDDARGQNARAGLKHGPGGRGGPGPCDAGCWKCSVGSPVSAPCCVVAEAGYACKCRASTIPSAPVAASMCTCGHPRPDHDWWGSGDCTACDCAKFTVDPLDVEYDGISLRDLLTIDGNDQREVAGPRRRARRTPAQHAAVSAHWSAQLRAKVAASAAADKARATSVVVDMEDP